MAITGRPAQLIKKDGAYYGMLECQCVGLYYSETKSYRSNLLVVGLFNIVFSFPTIILNILVLLAFIRRASLRKIASTILISLSFCDLLSGLIAQPVLVSLISVMLTKEPTEVPCLLVILSSIIGYTLACISLLTVSFISLERYLAIFYPFVYERIVTKRWLYGGCAIIWTTSVVMVPVLLLIKRMNPYFYYVNAILITFVYIWNIYIYVRITQRANKLKLEQEKLQSRFGTPHTSSSSHQSKATKVAGSIIVALLLCYLPQVIVSVWQVIHRNRFLYEFLEYWTMTFGLLNPGLNPIFYCYYNSQIRNELLQLIRFRTNDVTPTNSSSATPQIFPHRMRNLEMKERSATTITYA